MAPTQVEMFQDKAPARRAIAPELLRRVRDRLETTLTRLEGETRFCWTSNLEAIHEENNFRSGVQMLGDDGHGLWERFDREMERLFASEESNG